MSAQAIHLSVGRSDGEGEEWTLPSYVTSAFFVMERAVVAYRHLFQVVKNKNCYF